METTELKQDTEAVSFRDSLRALGERPGSGIPALEELFAQTPSGADELLTQLAQEFRRRRSGLRELQQLAADFGVVSCVEGSAGVCVWFRQDTGLLFVLADPLDARTRGCVDQHMRMRPGLHYGWALASVGDITALLAAREKDVRALDTLAFDDPIQRANDPSALALTLQGISNYDTPVGRLLNSTIYDALKIQASDIHLEGRANGLVSKCRVDGVLTMVGTSECRGTG